MMVTAPPIGVIGPMNPVERCSVLKVISRYMDMQNKSIPVNIAINMRLSGKEKRSAFKEIIKIPMDRNPW